MEETLWNAQSRCACRYCNVVAQRHRFVSCLVESDESGAVTGPIDAKGAYLRSSVRGIEQIAIVSPKLGIAALQREISEAFDLVLQLSIACPDITGIVG